MADDPQARAHARREATRSYVIVATAYVTPARHLGRDPYFEIVAAADLDPSSARYAFATRDETIIARAVAAEGTDQRFALTWRGVIPAPKRDYLHLATLEAV